MRSSSESTTSARVATIMSVTRGQEAMRRTLWMTSGVPSSSRNCFGVSAPMRVPRPAAGRMAAMRLILGATRLDRNIDGAANFRVYLKRARQANGRVPEDVVDGAPLDQQERKPGKNILSGQRVQIIKRKNVERVG